MSLRLNSIRIHPVKSTAIRPVPRAEVDRLGLVGDRRWMIVDETGECVTARELHALLRIVTDPRGDAGDQAAALRLRAAGSPELTVSAPTGPPVPVTVHGRPLLGIPVADGATAWLEGVTGRAGMRLVHLGRPRPLNPEHSAPGDATAFADGYPVTLATTSSLRRLQGWVEDLAEQRGEPDRTIAMDRFRPNLVVDGDLPAFAEDGWTRVRVGSVEFRVAKQVDRCVLTTIDPQTLTTGPEPIRTLARERKRDGKTWFGLQLIPTGPGAITVGDEVLPSG